jgi:hypothetical protein
MYPAYCVIVLAATLLCGAYIASDMPIRYGSAMSINVESCDFGHTLDPQMRAWEEARNALWIGIDAPARSTPEDVSGAFDRLDAIIRQTPCEGNFLVVRALTTEAFRDVIERTIDDQQETQETLGELYDELGDALWLSNISAGSDDEEYKKAFGRERDILLCHALVARQRDPKLYTLPALAPVPRAEDAFEAEHYGNSLYAVTEGERVPVHVSVTRSGENRRLGVDPLTGKRRLNMFKALKSANTYVDPSASMRQQLMEYVVAERHGVATTEATEALALYSGALHRSLGALCAVRAL